jgi:putative heme-binding domain-containing protein
MRILLTVSLLLPACLGAQDDAAAGRMLFLKSCSACHGENAKGGRAADLTSGQFKWGGSDAEIQRNILNGIANTQMPAFPMAAREAEQIVAYLRTLQSGLEEVTQGDAAAGRKLFFGAGGCAKCHMRGGRGGRLGPDLSVPRRIDLRQAILNPDESLRPGYETVEVRLASGQTLRGAKKNEDTFSIQIMDESERLHMLQKSGVKQIDRPHKSLMPASKLSAAELDNVVAFLSARGEAAAPNAEWKPAADLNVSFARLKNAPSEPRNWLTYWGDYQGTHFSRLDSIKPANAGSLAAQWSYQFGAGDRAAGRRRADVRDRPAEQRGGARRAHGPRHLALQSAAAASRLALHRDDQPGSGYSWRPPVPRHARLAPGLARRKDRIGDLGCGGRRLQEGLFDHARAAGDRRENYRRDHGRRVCAYGLYRRL